MKRIIYGFYLYVILISLAHAIVNQHPSAVIGIGDNPSLQATTDKTGEGGRYYGYPINTQPAISLNKNIWWFEFRNDYSQYRQFSDAKLTALAKQVGRSTQSVDYYEYTQFIAAYGITDTFALGASLPFSRLANVRRANIELIETGEGNGIISKLGNAQGLSDMILFGQLQIFDDLKHKIAGMLSFGTYAPTGETHSKTNFGDLFPPDNQPGRGSFAPYLGLVFTRDITDGSISLNFFYTKSFKGAQEAKLGDYYDYNLALVHTLYETKSHYDLYGIWEFNGEYTTKTIVDGKALPDTGSNLINFTTALRLRTPRNYYPFIGFSIPIIQSINGVQPKFKYDLICGLDIALV